MSFVFVTDTLDDIMSRVESEPVSCTAEDLATIFGHSIDSAADTLLKMIKLGRFIDDEKNSSVAYEKIRKTISALFNIKSEVNALKTLYDEEIPF